MRNLFTRPAVAGMFDSAMRRRLSGWKMPAQITAMALVFASGSALAQDVFKPPPPVTYTERYEVYGGINYMNFQAGQALPQLMNLGGGEAMATWWVTPRIGAVADARFGGGTTPVLPGLQALQPTGPTRVFVTQTIGMLGAQYRGPKNQHVGLNYHALAGVSHGSFDWDVPQNFLSAAGLYTNRTKPIAALGVSLDFNRSAKFAVRLSPDLILEHFGSETRTFFAISAGVVYRFGKRD